MYLESEIAQAPVLLDGTKLAELVDFERREVRMRVLMDPEIYQLELERLFAKAWIPLAHTSEIPSAGDFVTRRIGEDSVIVVRDVDGQVNVLLNVCQHRGMEISRVSGGNTRTFLCPYHSWCYDTSGHFRSSPVAKERMHGNMMSKEELHLPRARTEHYCGMIFATWDETAPPLADYLGPIKWYLDLMWDRTKQGIKVTGPPLRHMVPANWKCAGEQSASDGYHILSLHRSLAELNGHYTKDGAGTYGIDVSANGHSLRCIPSRRRYALLRDQPIEGLSSLERLRLLPPPGISPEGVEELAARFSPEQLRILADSPPQAGGLFPACIVLNAHHLTPDGIAGSMAWHSFVPHGVDSFELYTWVFVVDGQGEYEDINRRSAILNLGPTGMVEMDDAEAWPSIYRSSRGAIGRNQKLRYQALLGENKPQDWPGPGLVYEGFSKDDTQWNWWQRYFQFMFGTPW